MSCSPLQPVSCVAAAVQQGANVAANAVGDSFAESIRDGAKWVVTTTIGWWIDVPAIDLTTSPAERIRGYVLWLAIVIAVAGVVWQGVLMAVSRRPEPLFAVVRGLFLLALWTSLGIAGPAVALRAGDAFSNWVLNQAAGGQASTRLVAIAGLSQVSAPGAVIVLGLVMMLAGLVQAVLMLFREAAVVILAGVVVLAAAGSMMGGTKPWLPRVLGWMLALICYKPAAALVYASALTLAGQGQDARSVLVGMSMIVLSIIALPALMRLFTWTTGTVAGGGGGLAALAGASAASLHAAAALSSSRGTSPSGQAGNVHRDLDSSSSTSPTPARTTGAHPTAASPAPPTGGAAPPSPAASSSATAATGGAASTTAAGAVSPWILAAQKLTEAARRGADAARGAGDAMTPKDEP